MAAALAAGVFSLHGAPARAAAITVDGVNCTLVEAIENANTDADGSFDPPGPIFFPGNGCAAGSGADVLTLTANQAVTSTLRIPSGVVTINGGGNTIDGSGISGSGPSLFTVLIGGDLRIVNAVITGRDSQNTGGAFYVQGGALLKLEQCTVSGNAATAGGGIWNRGTTTLSNSTVSGNTAYSVGGGVFNSRYGTLVVEASSAIVNNVAGVNLLSSEGQGGGISNQLDAIVQITDSIVSGNRARSGGGLTNNGAVSIVKSTVSGNSARFIGGGITTYQSGTLSLSNTTVSGNSAYTGGGGLAMQYGNASIVSSTITGNTSTIGGGISSRRFYQSGFSRTISDSIISGNFGGDVSNSMSALNDFTSQGDNLIGDGDATGLFNAPGDQVGVLAPLLGPLADNGGPTRTHALLAGSPALDTAVNGACVATDQRGVTRPKGAACDIGAYELSRVDLAIDKTASDSSVLVGETVTFTLTVSNNGPAGASGVEVADTLPSAFNLVSAAPTQGTCAEDPAQTVVCMLGTIANGSQASVSLVTTATTAGTFTNTGSVIGAAVDSDTVADNNADSASVTVEEPDTAPSAFMLGSRIDVALNSVQTSNTVTISGINTSAPISVGGGTYDIGCDGGFTSAPGTITNGQMVCVQHTASALNLTTVTTTLNIGGVMGSFSSTTVAAAPPPDTTPDGFSFAPRNDVALSSIQTSDAATISGLTAPSPISVSGGLYDTGCDGGATAVSGFISNGQTVCVQHTASALNATATTTNLTIGGVVGSFTSTTVAAMPPPPPPPDGTPDAFGFPPRNNVALSSTQTSDAATISGLTVAAPISVSGGTYDIGCDGGFTNAAGSITNGQTVCVQHTASALNSTATTTTLTIGGVMGSFTSTTLAGPPAGPVLVTSRFTPTLSGQSTNPSPVAEGAAGVFSFTSRFCNTAAEGISGAFSRTRVLSPGKSLISRSRAAPSGAPGGVGSEQDFPDTLLTPSECVNVLYRIGLDTRTPFTFRVDLLGNVVP